METKDVLVLLTNQWADWEVAYVMPFINDEPQYKLKTISVNKESKVSMGGLNVKIDYSLSDYNNFNNVAMVILPGGLGWKEENSQEIVDFIKRIIEFNIPLAAICGATIFLGKHGFLDKVKHTGDELEFFTNEVGYHGEDFYVSAQIVVDKGIITANETAALEFTCAIFKELNITDDEHIQGWYDYFKNGMVR